MNVEFFHVYIVALVFLIIEYVHEPLDFIKGGLVCKRFLEYVVNACPSWFLMKGAPPNRGRCFLKICAQSSIQPPRC